MRRNEFCFSQVETEWMADRAFDSYEFYKNYSALVSGQINLQEFAKLTGYLTESLSISYQEEQQRLAREARYESA